ncbi:unnamed protein product [Merluccius merluccius]
MPHLPLRPRWKDQDQWPRGLPPAKSYVQFVRQTAPTAEASRLGDLLQVCAGPGCREGSPGGSPGSSTATPGRCGLARDGPPADLLAAAAEVDSCGDAPPAVPPPPLSLSLSQPPGTSPSGHHLWGELLPRGWRQTLPEEQHDWVGRALFRRAANGQVVLASQLRLWWHPPGARPLYTQPPATSHPFFQRPFFLWAPYRMWAYHLRCPTVACGGKLAGAGLYKTITKKLAGGAAGTAAWVTNVGNEYGQVLMSVLTAAEGVGLVDMAAGVMRRYREGGELIGVEYLFSQMGAVLQQELSDPDAEEEEAGGRAVTREPADPAEPAEPAAAGTSGPSRCTVHRRRVRAAQDRKVLESSRGEPQHTPGDPCDICGQARTLDGGHAYHKGVFFCAAEEGPGGRTSREWTSQRLGPDGLGEIPRTTAWNMKRRQDGPQKTGGKVRKPHKLRICHLCGQAKLKDFGHSQYRGEHFCALYTGKTVELWLSEKRLTVTQ